MSKRILSLMLSVLMLVGMMALPVYADDEVKPRSVTISPSGNRTIQKDKTMKLSYRISPSDADTDIDVTWSSSDEDVVTVDDDGWVVAVDYGTAKVTVKTANGKSASVTITVPGGKESSLEEGWKDWSASSVSESSTAPASSVSSETSSSKTTTTTTSNKKISREDLLKAVRGSSKTVSLKGYTSVSASSLQAAADASSAKVRFDTVSGKKTVGCLTITPSRAAKLEGDIKVGVTANSSTTETAQNYVDKTYSNDATVIYCAQSDFGMTVTVTALVGKMDSSDLKFYSCDKNGKNVKELSVTGAKLDSKGYVKFNTTKGGYIIVADGALTK